jgi:acid phosphatase (class A)
MNYETVGDKIIFYSLGNFIFDTDYQRSQHNTDIGLLVRLDLTPERFTFEPFGLKISKEETPEIYKVLREGTATCDSICTLPKRYYMRKRPFMRFNEPTLYPADEPNLKKNGSFPSGHTLLGWSSALLLSEINPDRADTLLARGLMYGESRVIVGAHWQSDVDAARLAASAAYARLHTSERFLEQMRLAREEFRVKTGLATIIEMKAWQKEQKKRAKAAAKAAKAAAR